MLNKKLFLLIIPIALVGASCDNSDTSNVKNDQSAETSAQTQLENTDTMQKDNSEDAMVQEDKMMKDESTTQSSTNAQTAVAVSSYQDYSAQSVQQAISANKKVVLFFHANWCPFCRTADKAFTSNLDAIPNNVVVLKTDYDSQTELKKKYGVTTQHTFIQIDNNQNKVGTWISGDIDALKANIK